MNQLILDPREAHIYGGVHPADVFREEIEIVLRNPGAKLTIDITGPTIYDLTWATPDIIDKIRIGIERGQIEILDIAHGQIPIQFMNQTDVKKHYEFENKLIKRLFGVTPNGSWIEDRQWTINVTKILADLGIKYTVIDDNTFFRGNPNASEFDVFYPHWSIYQGRRIAVFHISEYMRYNFRSSPSNVISYLDDLRTRNPNANMIIVVYGDDAEFGLNENTFKQLLKLPWVKFVTPSEYLEMFNDTITSANYDVIGAYREYEHWFGENGTWAYWYSSATAKYILSKFDNARNHILELEKYSSQYPQLNNLVEDAWTALLLSEWQFGPFYKTSEPSNLRWSYDAIAMCNLAKLWIENHNNSPALMVQDIKENGKNYAIIITENLGIAIDLATRTLEYLIDFRIGREIAGLEYLEDWWVHKAAGMVIPELYANSQKLMSFQLNLDQENGQVIFTSTNGKVSLIYKVDSTSNRVGIFLRAHENVTVTYRLNGRFSPSGFYYLMNYGNNSHVPSPTGNKYPFLVFDDRIPFSIIGKPISATSEIRDAMWGFEVSSSNTISLERGEAVEVLSFEFSTELIDNTAQGNPPTVKTKMPLSVIVLMILSIIDLISLFALGIKVKATRFKIHENLK